MNKYSVSGNICDLQGELVGKPSHLVDACNLCQLLHLCAAIFLLHTISVPQPAQPAQIRTRGAACTYCNVYIVLTKSISFVEIQIKYK